MKKILIIDDDHDFGAAIGGALRRAGFETRVAQGGHVGVKLFKEQPADLVISDVLMPDGDGVEAVMAIRKINPTVPIIAMSGGGLISPETYQGIARACGVNSFLNKPFDLSRLIELINQSVNAGGLAEDTAFAA